MERVRHMHFVHGILFDFDRTLAELHIDFAKMRQQVAEMASVFMDQSVCAQQKPVLEWIEDLAADMAERMPRDEVLEFQSRCRMRLIGLEMQAAKRGRLFPFTRPVMEQLRSLGMKTAVVTRNCTAALRTMDNDLERYVDCVLARDDVNRVKPDPEHLHTALDRLGLAPDKCLMVGDHWLDIVAGQRAGMRSAGVCSGKVGREELAAYAPDFLAQDVQDLIDHLQNQGILPMMAEAELADPPEQTSVLLT